MFKVIKTKKILSFVIIFSVIGVIFAGYFSSIVKAQVDDGTGGEQYQSPAPTNQNTAPSTNSTPTGNNSGVVTTAEYQAILGQVTGVTDETRTQTNLQNTGVVSYKDTNMSLAPENATCAWSQIFSNPVGTLIGCVFNPLIGGVARLFANLIQRALDMNAQLFTSSYINNGWTVARDIANLGFVLIMIIIAFGTILRMENYGFKKTLTKLIVAALLVNFSLMICAALVSLSDIITHYFITNGFQGHPGDNIASALGLTSKNGLSFNMDLPSIPGGIIKAVVGLIFGLILLVIVTITLAAIAVMLLIRYVVLGILIVLSPLAWLCSILPGTANLWKKWWSNFIHWVIFAPLMLFFVWLAMFAPAVSTSSSTGVMDGVGNLFIMTGLLLGGLMIANSLGITGAKQFNKWATAGAVGVGAFVGSRAKRTALQSPPARWATNSLKSTGLGRSGALRAISQPFRKAGARVSSARDKNVGILAENYEKEFEKMKTGDVVKRAQLGNAEEKVAAFNILAKRNKISKLSTDELNSIQTIGARFGRSDEMEKAIKEQAPHLSREIQDEFKKGPSGAASAEAKLQEMFSKMSASDLKKVDFVHMAQHSQTQPMAAKLILNSSKRNLTALNKIYENEEISEENLGKIHDSLAKEIKDNPATYKDISERIKKQKNISMRTLAT